MPRYPEFVEFVIERMSFIEGLRVRAMFGGYGVYRDDLIFAVVIDDGLYFKADALSRGEFEAKGLHPFVYVARTKSITMQYFEAPPEVFEEPQAMRSWVQKAIGAAVRARQTKASRQAARPSRGKPRPAGR